MMPDAQAFNGSLHELRARWREILPLAVHSARLVTFDGDGTLQLAVLGQMSGQQQRTLAYQARRAIAVIDGVAVRRVRCRHVSRATWEQL
jgi:hypothetical protein